MKSVAIFVGLLAATVVAQPHGHKHRRQHNHNHGQQKRDFVTVYETELEVVTVTEYIDDTTTEWITPAAKTSDVPDITTTQPTANPTTTQIPGQFFEGASSSSAPSSSEASPAAGTPESSTTIAPIIVPTTSVEAAPAPTVAATSAASPVTDPTTAAAAPAAVETSSSGSGADKHTGDLTYYTVGMGACGEDDSGKDMKENIVALSHLLMGEKSNGNPYCGRTITISYGGKTIQAIVKDKCMGCALDNIDVSTIAFTSLMGSTDVGRHAVDWWFN